MIKRFKPGDILESTGGWFGDSIAVVVKTTQKLVKLRWIAPTEGTRRVWTFPHGDCDVHLDWSCAVEQLRKIAEVDNAPKAN